MRVTVIGTGYVGTVTGACLSYLGHQVTCVDTDEAKIAKLQRGESPIYEPYLMQMGLLDRTQRGRMATPLAYKHFGLERWSSGRASIFDFSIVCRGLCQ